MGCLPYQLASRTFFHEQKCFSVFYSTSGWLRIIFSWTGHCHLLTSLFRIMAENAFFCSIRLFSLRLCWWLLLPYRPVPWWPRRGENSASWNCILEMVGTAGWPLDFFKRSQDTSIWWACHCTKMMGCKRLSPCCVFQGVWKFVDSPNPAISFLCCVFSSFSLKRQRFLRHVLLFPNHFFRTTILLFLSEIRDFFLGAKHFWNIGNIQSFWRIGMILVTRSRCLYMTSSFHGSLVVPWSQTLSPRKTPKDEGWCQPTRDVEALLRDQRLWIWWAGLGFGECCTSCCCHVCVMLGCLLKDGLDF